MKEEKNTEKKKAGRPRTKTEGQKEEIKKASEASEAAKKAAEAAEESKSAPEAVKEAEPASAVEEGGKKRYEVVSHLACELETYLL